MFNWELALLSFRIESDEKKLKSNFNTTIKNGTIVSPSIQNEIVKTIGDVIENKVVNSAKASKYYSILCDETTEISKKEQMTLFIFGM